MNVTEFPANATSQKPLTIIIKVCAVIPCFTVYLCCIVVMLHIFASHRQILDTSRYILFAYMLINDTLQITSSVLLFLFSMLQIKLSLVLCIPLLFVSTATFQSSPLILATMSLERYVAIIYPLQRPAAWRSDRTWVIILLVCVISCAYPMIDYAIGDVDPAITGFSTPVICTPGTLNSSPVQTLYRAACNFLFFTVVAIIILYTYVRILLETRKMRQDQASVNKAMYTVLLHGFQLLLCMLAFTRPITETLIVLHKDLNPADLFYINYFFFILLPRFLSPLIYGFRDQALRRHIQNSFLCCSKKRVQPCVRIKMQKNLLVSQKSKLGFVFSRIQRSVYSSQKK
ncbi:odorant receptor 131-2-like [Gouania willdenowi]|uniref:odorant receptor 131-2-like n=1 Tax=Gouania willdenowi TaxID=441366 RepID=UPI00105571D8|nr:odorant receptor 131-2-like [Gouania willdenowi]